MFFPISFCLFVLCYVLFHPRPSTAAVTRPGYKLGPSLAPDRAWCWPSSTHCLAPLRAQTAAFFLWQRQQEKKKRATGWQQDTQLVEVSCVCGPEAEAAIRRLGRGSCLTASTRKHKGRRRSCSEAPAGQGSAQTFWSSSKFAATGWGERRRTQSAAMKKVTKWRKARPCERSRLWTGAFLEWRCHKQVAFCRSEWKLETALEGCRCCCCCRRSHILTLWIFSKTNTKMNAALEVNSNQILCECKSPRLWKHTSADHLTNHVAI